MKPMLTKGSACASFKRAAKWNRDTKARRLGDTDTSVPKTSKTWKVDTMHKSDLECPATFP